MCLAIPGKIVSEIKDQAADVDFGGVKRSVQMNLLPDARKGEYVIVHAGFAIQKISAKDARHTMKLLNEAFNE